MPSTAAHPDDATDLTSYDAHVAAAGRRGRSVWHHIVLPLLLVVLVGVSLPGILEVLLNLVIGKRGDSDSATGLSATLGMVIGMPIGLWLIVKLSHVTPTEIGFDRGRALKGILGGILGGALAISGTFVVNALTGSVDVRSVFSGNHLPAILLSAVFFAFQGTWEEIWFRSYLMPQFSQYMRPWMAMVITSLIFTIAHGLNGNLSTMGLINLFIFGMVFAAIFWRTGNSWLTGLGHGSWNFFLGIVYGSHVSGVLMGDTFLTSLPHTGHDLLSGGQYGMEGSIVSSLVGLALVAANMLPGRRSARALTR